MEKSENPKLSICIATKNRGDLIAQTLESIVSQIEDDVEILVLDGASTDNTGKVLEAYAEKYPFFRYIVEDENSGVDSGYDQAVLNAYGEYCWVMTDDDLLAPGAVRRVLSEIEKNYDLVVVNIACFNKDLSKDLNQKLFRMNKDVIYQACDSEKFFTDLAEGLSFIGCVVIKRSMWMEKPREPFFGTEFVHIGVIFGNSIIKNAILVSKPYIIYRSGNSAWSERSFDIWYRKWPTLIWSFPRISASAKQKVVLQKPWLRLRSLVRSRAIGEYSRALFYSHIADRPLTPKSFAAFTISMIPSKFVNFCYVVVWSIFKRSELYTLFNLLISPSSSTASRAAARALGINIL